MLLLLRHITKKSLCCKSNKKYPGTVGKKHSLLLLRFIITDNKQQLIFSRLWIYKLTDRPLPCTSPSFTVDIIVITHFVWNACY